MINARIETKEEFIKTKNGMKIQKIVMYNASLHNNSGEEKKKAEIKKKHIVYFPGLTYTFEKEPDEDKSEWNWAIEAGMDVHFVNFPGSGKSKGNSLNGRNRVDAGIAVIANLLEQGIHPESIVLYGSCAGGPIAAEVHKKFKDNNIYLKCIINKSFSSLKKLIVGLLHMPKRIFSPVVKFILKCFGWHFKPHTIINDITPYTIYFNLENDGFINQKATLGTKTNDIERNGRQKAYQRIEDFSGFEKYKEFFIEHTNLTKIPKAKNLESKVGIIKRCWNKFLSLLPIKGNDIHFSPITELCSSNAHHYTLPESILLFLELTDSYFKKRGSRNDRYKTEEFIQKPEFQDFLNQKKQSTKTKKGSNLSENSSEFTIANDGPKSSVSNLCSRRFLQWERVDNLIN